MSHRLSRTEVLGALLFLAIFTVAGTMPMQNDSWWHLRTGLTIWQRHEVPRHDLFAFTTPPDYPWPNHEWLAQGVMYPVYLLGGLPLLTLFCAALATLSLLPSYLLTVGRPLQRACLLIIALPLIRVGWSVRPQVFTLFFLGVTVWLLVRQRYLWLPALFLVWANMHGGVTLGGLVMVGSVAAAVLFDRRRLVPLLLCTACCGAATLLTPLSWHILTFPLESVHRLKAAGINEWRSPDVQSIRGLLFWLFCALYLYALATGWRRRRGWEDRLLVVLSSLFLLMAATSLRNIPHFLMLAVPAVTRLLPALSVPVQQPARRTDFLFLCGGMALAVAFLCHAYAAPLLRLEWRPMSEAAVAAVRSCPQPMYNTYDNGGYLLWFTPERKVFIDSRQDPFPAEFLGAALRALRTGEYEALFARYHIRSAAVGPGDPVGRRLLQRGWHKVYGDDLWLVLRE